MSAAVTCGARYGTVTITLNIRSVNVKKTYRSHQVRAFAQKRRRPAVWTEDAAICFHGRFYLITPTLAT